MRIILGVCGSIAAYKSYDLTRLLIKAGHQVRIVLTEGALHFVKPEVFRYLGAQAVYTAEQDFRFPHESNDDLQGTVLHIELSQWCERLAIAPLSANTISRLSRGEASDLLSSLFLSLEQHKPIMLFPAMNTQMYNHPFTQENLEQVQKLKRLPQVYLCPPDVGELACGDQGIGKLPAIEKIAQHIIHFQPKQAKTKQILISTGATIAPLDPVRFLTNASSGVTGFIVAQIALLQGHQVHVIAGKFAVPELDLLLGLPNYKLSRVTTAQDMQACVLSHLDQADAYISAAAVGDIEFEAAEHKLKKHEMENSIKFRQAPDILQHVMARKQQQKIIGFAAETELSDEVLKQKWERKPVDFLVGTKVHHGLSGDQARLQGFNVDHAEYRFFDGREFSAVQSLSKQAMAQIILQKVLS